MRKSELNPKILQKLNEKTEVKEKSIRNALSRIRKKYPFLTLNAAAEVYARKRNFSISRYLDDKDREAFKTVEIKKIEIPSTKKIRRKELIKIASYETDDKLLKAHLNEINKAYTYGCYTATFVLCRKVLENLLVYHILRKKYPLSTEQHRSKHFDFSRNRNLDFNKLLVNLRDSANDFVPDNNLVERICQLADGFKETANEMAHSLYHLAKKREIDNKDFQQILDLIKRLEKSF